MQPLIGITTDVVDPGNGKPLKADCSLAYAQAVAEAGALPLAGLTAWQALVETADVQPDQRVLILGAAGGVGHLAVQIAKTRGAHVIGEPCRFRPR